ncbi:hypothetical protein FY034_18980 (plasmid) [Trichlorobacter lovleyi]|nr:hypothetical protein [Trichlorobacter lovleyi]QOX81062.1 hypothetical protein FY034_18980 [Trichlorobacter lovleyi]
MKRIVWKSKITGFCGNGQPIDSSVAEKMAAEMNEQYPDIEHWTEVV